MNPTLQIIVDGRRLFNSEYPPERTQALASALSEQWPELVKLGKRVAVIASLDGVSHIIATGGRHA